MLSKLPFIAAAVVTLAVLYAPAETAHVAKTAVGGAVHAVESGLTALSH